ncbi:MAG: tetraacyldisaccharide 4'-kinase [Bacteroidia bacterium]|nr:tetraacyldisaccharide 4'-kinase [Bacteroidia bacterium]
MPRISRYARQVGRLFLGLAALPVALLYGVGVSIRNWLYDRGWLPVYRLPCVVVSVGNLTLGGSGKTPFALYLLEWFSNRGIRAAYLSRGYGRQTRGFAEVSLATPQAAAMYGDEPCLAKVRFPHLPVAVCEDRVAGGRELLQRYPHLKVIVLDDAFQHRRLHRNLNILLIDMQRPIWKDWIFPLGRLREPLRAYRRADLIVLNRKSLDKVLRRPRFHKPTLEFKYAVAGLRPAWPHLPSLSVDDIRFRGVLVFCGIARPDSFYTTLYQAKAYVLKEMRFPDHHLYTDSDLRRIRRAYHRCETRLRGTNLILLTTEKDLVRLRESEHYHILEGLPLYAVQIAMVPTNPSETDELLTRFFQNLLES